MSAGRRVFDAVPIGGGTRSSGDLRRADIAVDGLDQAGPSFDLRIYLNRPDADAATEPTEDNGYAGSIHVYGYGSGSASGSGEAPASPGVDAGSGGARAWPRIPMSRSIIATDAVRRARAAGSRASVTLIAVPYDAACPEIDLDAVDVAVLVDE